MSENYALIRTSHKHPVNLSRMYYVFLAAQILFGIIVFAAGFKEPLTLLVLSAVINAVCMFVHIGLVNLLNMKELPRVIKPNKARIFVIICAFLFFGIFSTISIYNAVNTIF